MRPINVVTLQRLPQRALKQIESVDPRVKLTDAATWFDGEYRETWPARTASRFLDPDAHGSGTREQRDAMLREAEVVLGGWPYPLDLKARAP